MACHTAPSDSPGPHEEPQAARRHGIEAGERGAVGLLRQRRLRPAPAAARSARAHAARRACSSGIDAQVERGAHPFLVDLAVALVEIGQRAGDPTDPVQAAATQPVGLELPPQDERGRRSVSGATSSSSGPGMAELSP